MVRVFFFLCSRFVKKIMIRRRVLPPSSLCSYSLYNRPLYNNRPNPTYQFITGSACIPKRRRVSIKPEREGDGVAASAIGAVRMTDKDTGGVLFRTGKEWHSNSCGEDSWLCRGDLIAVADGVGGWPASTKANPSLYSRLLLDNIGTYLTSLEDPNNLDLGEDELESISSADVLRRAYQAMDPAVIGSTTVTMALLQSPFIHLSLLGDCGFMIFRRNGILIRSEEQQHSFNYPYQLSSKRINSAEDAIGLQVRVEPGDLVLLGSDGLFDNLFDDDILKLVTESSITEPIDCLVLESEDSQDSDNSNSHASSSSSFILKYRFHTPSSGDLDRLASMWQDGAA